MNEYKHGGAHLASALASYGLTHIFFVDAILRHTLAHLEDHGIHRVLAHSEKAAAYMADGYARVLQRPAVCMAQSVGAANLAAGLQDALLARSPIIAITGRHIAENQYRNAYQELPHEPMFRAVTKFSARIDVPQQVSQLLRQAFREATTGRTGPVHLDVAGNTGSATDYWTTALESVIEPEFMQLPPFRIHPDPALVSRSAKLLSSATRPLIVAGIGVNWSGAQAALRLFVEASGLPLVTTLDTKPLLPATHPLNVGVMGTYGTDAANRAVAEADVVLYVGCDLGDQESANWMLPQDGTATIQVDVDPSELGRNLPGAVKIQSDPLAMIEALGRTLSALDLRAWLDRIAGLRNDWIEKIREHRVSDAVPMRPERLCEELGRVLPGDAILVADTGYASQWTGQMLDMRGPSQTYLRAAGSLGWAFPAALGAKAASPDRPVVCFTGDGGFMYHLPELETARRWNLATVTIVNNNGQLGQGLRNLRTAYAGRDGRMDELYKFKPLDYAAIAESFGCNGIRVTDPEAVGPAIRAGLDAGRPTVIDVVSDPAALAPIPWMPKTQCDML
ncbi:MAG: thiamine pyrophosphate-binding protein [Caldimonas sp.]